MVDEAASPSSFTFPKFLRKFAFSSEFRDLAEKSTLQAKENYAKLKTPRRS